MKKSYLALLVSIIFILATVGSSFAAMGEGTVSAKKGVDLTLFGSNRVIPTWCSNMNDFDSDTHDGITLDEGGFYAGFFVHNELRLGFAGKGENFGFSVILENDIHYTKDNVDRNTYTGYGNNSSDFGGEFGVERSKFWYDFGPVKFTTGWDVTWADLKTGGLVYGDDHPFMMLSGKAGDSMDWQLNMLLINDSDDLYSGNQYRDTDWYAYIAKMNFKFSGMTVSPFAVFSDMRKGVQKTGNAQSYYFGLEGYGKVGMLMPSFEIVGVTGTINDAAAGGTKDYDISSFAAFASLKFDLMPEFQPYIGGFYVQGDDDNTDNDADGFVGITNITRYTPTFGMEGAYIYEHISGIGSPLYGLTPERLGNATARYGGISAAGTGNNPGLIYIGAGATGKVGGAAYKVQTAYMWFEEKDGLGLDNDEIGLTVDAQATYKFSPNFSINYTISGLFPGDGVEDLKGNDDTAWITRSEIVWTW
ncbi:MAG: hypothetical protein JXR80_06925 [Deltaproteobacteria bacterium]|nr:hypothetical protein [Deltaproteobacteria bacterium]